MVASVAPKSLPRLGRCVSAKWTCESQTGRQDGPERGYWRYNRAGMTSMNSSRDPNRSHVKDLQRACARFRANSKEYQARKQVHGRICLACVSALRMDVGTVLTLPVTAIGNCNVLSLTCIHLFCKIAYENIYSQNQHTIVHN